MRWPVPFTMLLLSGPACACLVFCVSDDGHVFGGNNEDYFEPDTRMWFVPADAGKHGRVYFGYANGFPQGGLNDAGLFFDGLALDREPIVPKPGEKEAAPAGNIADLAMAECATVEQVIALFETHDRSMLEYAQLFFGDRSGDAAILEGNAVIRKEGRALIATNFRQSKTPPEEASCERHRIASRILGDTEEVSVDLCRRVLAATHQEGEVSTLYSNVYDLERGLVYLYHFHDYEEVVVIDLAAELAKGARVVELASLFQPTYAFECFRQQAEAAVVARQEKERDKSVDPRTFADFTGKFRTDEGVAAGLEFEVRVEGNALMIEFPGQGKFELIPRGGASFACIAASTRAAFDFVRGDDGVVSGVTLKQGEIEVLVPRVE
jgi:hypothetical protein